MKYLFALCCMLLVFTTANAQFTPSGKDLMIVVTDGTDSGRNSEVIQPRDIPSSYDNSGNPGNSLVFTDPIRSLGMTDCIQAAAFLERPVYGKIGYMLIFSISDAIGGKQATLTMQDGRTYRGVYRLIRQKTSPDEPVPPGMTNYQVVGTFFLLGIS